MEVFQFDGTFSQTLLPSDDGVLIKPKVREARVIKIISDLENYSPISIETIVSIETIIVYIHFNARALKVNYCLPHPSSNVQSY